MGNPITDTMFGLRDFGRRLLARPDALMLELGAGGELLVSQMRAALAMLLPLLPLINVIGGGKLRESMIGLLGAVLAIVMSQVWLAHRLPTMLEVARGQGCSLSLCLIDLDYFKRINDELGHLAGDRALRHVVETLDQQMEDGDWLARLGGEEFALLLPLPVGRAWERLEAMRRTVASQPFVPEHGAEPMRLTFSAGIACWPQDGADLSQLLRKADLRLRHAKLEGRNRVLARDP